MEYDNMDIKSFQHDLKNGMSIDEACQIYNITLKQAFDQLHIKKQPNKVKPQSNRRYCPTHYIQHWKGRYYLRKCIPVIEKGKPRNKTVQFGTYSSLEDAIKVREAMKEDGWHIKHLPRICNELNIRRVH